MSDLVSVYLQHVDRLLAKHIPQPRRQEMIAELRSHLYFAAKDFMQLGVPADEAWHDALRRLGSAQVVADDLIRQYRGYDHRPAWRLAWLPLLLTALTLVSMAVAVRSPSHFLTQRIMAWGGLVVFAGFGYAVWRSRRWLVGPLVILSAVLGLAPVLWLTAGTAVVQRGGVATPISRRSIPFYRANTASRLAKLKRDLMFARLACAAVDSGAHVPHTANGFPTPSSIMVTSTGWVPGSIYCASVSHGVYYNIDTPWGVTQGMADDDWRQNGRQALQSLQLQLSETEAALADPSLIGASTWARPLGDLTLHLATLLVHTALLLGLNWLVLALSNLRRAAMNRNDPFLA